MFPPKTILFPVDFSAASKTASGLIAATAAHFGARLLLLHVVQLPPAWYGDAAGVAFDPAMDLEDDRAEKHRALSKLLVEAQNLEVAQYVSYGDPAQCIVEVAQDQRVDLVMMPSRGCGALRRFLLGSVTAKVLHDAECPVWTDVHLQAEQAPASSGPILCAVDLRPEDVPAIVWAAEFADSWGVELRLVHAVPWHEHGAAESAALRNALDEARTVVAKLEQAANIEAPVTIMPGKPAEVVHRTALKYDAGTIVIGEGSLHKLMGRLRTSAYAIIREAPCPVVRV